LKNQLSHGGLPYNETNEDFFFGISRPRNLKLMRIFQDMKIVEHTGHGIPTIVNKYGKEAFDIKDSYVNVVFKFNEEVSNSRKMSV
jgi:predicted HTH transcriptional regulator